MGQNAHRGRMRARRLPVAGCLVLLASAVLTGCGSSLAAATTVLGAVQDAQVVHADGTTITAVSGLHLRRGDLVRTGAQGRAELLTRGRVVFEGSQAAVQVLDGAHQALRHGAVVVDAKSGPRLTLDVAQLSVDVTHGSAVRAERSVTVRIGTLVGDAGITSDTGRTLRVDALSQVVVGGDALPDNATPLRLTDDDGEAHAAPSLVHDDLALVALASGIDTTGHTTMQVVTAAWQRPLEKAPHGVARSEQVLPVVIAAAGHPLDPQGRYHEAVALRADGGSWGVVAHRLDTDSSAVLTALDRFEQGAATGQVGSVPAALAFVSGASGSGTSLDGSGGGPNGNGGGVRPSASPSPSPTGTSVVGTVTDTIASVLKALPTPTVSPSQLLPAVPTVSAPAVSPLPSPLLH